MSHCPKCGIPLQPENQKFCPNCGAQLPAAQDAAGTPAKPAAPSFDPGEQMKKGMAYSAPLGLDKKTFLKKYSQGRKECVAAAIMGYITAGISIAGNLQVEDHALAIVSGQVNIDWQNRMV